MRTDQLVLGIDAGGTKTVAWLAVNDSHREPSIVGRGTAGGANPQSVGFTEALQNLDRAIAASRNDASVQPGPVAAAVVAVAGSDREENRRAFRQWAEHCRVADRFRVVHDGLPVLIAGTPEGWGIALISGTGSFAFGRDHGGRSARAGGWGYLIGDEGSGYAIALAGLRAAAQAADGRGPETRLLGALLDRLGLGKPEELVSAVYKFAADRRAIGALAEAVTETADHGDRVAQCILDTAAQDLAVMVAAVARKLDLSGNAFPLALSGGVLLGRADLQDHISTQTARLGLHPDPIAVVRDPVVGAVKLARREALRGR